MKAYIEDVAEFQTLETRIRLAEAKFKGVVVHSYTKPTRKDFERVYINQYKLPVPIPPGVKCVWYSLSTFQVRTYTTAYDLSETLSSGNLYNMQASDDNSSFKLLGVRGSTPILSYSYGNYGIPVYRSGNNSVDYFMPIDTDWTSNNLINLYIKAGVGWGVSYYAAPPNLRTSLNIPILDSMQSNHTAALTFSSISPGNSVYRNNRDLPTSGTFYSREQNVLGRTRYDSYISNDVVPGFVIYPIHGDGTGSGMSALDLTKTTLVGMQLTIYNADGFFKNQPAIVSGDSWYMASSTSGGGSASTTGRTSKFSFSFSTPYSAPYYYREFPFLITQSSGIEANNRDRFQDQGAHIYGLYATDSYDYIGESS